MFRSRNPVFEEFLPSSTGWVEEPTCHYILVDLPEFRKEEVKVQYDDSGYVKINGKKQVNDKKFVYFDQTFKVPENADVSKTTGNLADGILTITVPKKVIARKDSKKETPQENAKQGEKTGETSEKSNQKPEEENLKKEEKKEEIAEKEEVKEKTEEKKEVKENEQKISFPEKMIKKWEQESTVMQSAVEKIKENKEIVIAAAVAFSLGVLLSLKFASSRK